MTDRQLSARDLLRRDFKSFKSAAGWTIGMSTVPLSIRQGFMRSGDSMRDAMAAYAEELSLDAEFILTSYALESASKRDRELAVFVRTDSQQLRKALVDDLAQSTRESLDLQPWSESAPDGVTIWQQGNRKATRKQVSPELHRVLDALSSKM